MVTSSSTPRTDLPFLRRRSKAVPAAPPVPVSAAAPLTPTAPASAPATPLGRGGLDLGHRPPAPVPHRPPTTAPAAAPATGLHLGHRATPAAASPRAAALARQREAAKVMDHEVRLLFPAPGLRDVYELNLDNRVLRLTPLESAVGTLVVSGPTAIAWESVRRVTGGADSDGHTAGTPVMTGGNRPLLGYDGGNALVPLRHVRQLRRALFINRGTAPMGVRIASGASVAVPPPADGTQILLLALRIGNVVELRAEPVPVSWSDQQIWQEFNFTMTHRAPQSQYRS